MKLKLQNGDVINVTKKEYEEIKNCGMIVYVKNGVTRMSFCCNIVNKKQEVYICHSIEVI